MLYFFALFSQAYSSHPNIYYRAIIKKGILRNYNTPHLTRKKLQNGLPYRKKSD
jgi:hypothetical protein